MLAAINSRKAIFQNMYRVADPGLTIECTPCPTPQKMICKEDRYPIVYPLVLMPNGVQMMSRDIDGLVALSNNIGVIATEESAVAITCMTRGATDKHLQFAEDQIFAISMPLNAHTHSSHRSPAWAFEPASKILKTSAECYKRMYNHEPKITAIHGGLECGIFAEKLPGLDIVSFGPNTHDLHTPEERLSISSTQRMWAFLCEVLTAV